MKVDGHDQQSATVVVAEQLVRPIAPAWASSGRKDVSLDHEDLVALYRRREGAAERAWPLAAHLCEHPQGALALDPSERPTR